MTASSPASRLSAENLEAVSTLWKRECHSFVTSFTGGSMLPAIAPGQDVLVECGVDPQVGHVAVFRIEEGVCVHRIAVRSAQWLLPWGDANVLPDEPIAPEIVIGVIRGVPPPAPTAFRRLILRYLAPVSSDLAGLRRRVRLTHRIRGIWTAGPAALPGKIARTVGRKLAV